LWSVVPCLTIYLSPPHLGFPPFFSTRLSVLLCQSICMAPQRCPHYTSPSVRRPSWSQSSPDVCPTPPLPQLAFRSLRHGSQRRVRCLPAPYAMLFALSLPDTLPGPQPHRVCETGGVTHPTFDPPSTFFPSAISMLGGEPPLLIPFPHRARSRTDFGLSGGRAQTTFRPVSTVSAAGLKSVSSAPSTPRD